MNVPPIAWDDMYALGVPFGASICGTPYGYTVDPQPPLLIRKLLAELAIHPVPDSDRMTYIRHIRDLLIGLTDWTQAADSPLSNECRVAWADYRQMLRDLPAAYSGEGPIPWPDAAALLPQ